MTHNLTDAICNVTCCEYKYNLYVKHHCVDLLCYGMYKMWAPGKEHRLKFWHTLAPWMLWMACYVEESLSSRTLILGRKLHRNYSNFLIQKCIMPMVNIASVSWLIFERRDVLNFSCYPREVEGLLVRLLLHEPETTSTKTHSQCHHNPLQHIHSEYGLVDNMNLTQELLI